MSAEIRRQEKLKIVEKRKFRRRKLLGKYIAKILYRWDDRKFEEKYLRKLETNWQKINFNFLFLFILFYFIFILFIFDFK